MATASEQVALNSESNINILCVGLTTVDLISTVETYPKEDSDQRGLSFRKQRGGNASNSCTVLRQLNAPCQFLGVLPPTSDPEYKWLQTDFEERGIEVKGCVHSSTACPMASVWISRCSGSRTIVFCDHGHPELTHAQFMDAVGDRLLSFSWVHFELRPNVSEYVAMMETVLVKQRDQQQQQLQQQQHNKTTDVAQSPSTPSLTVSVEIEKPDLDCPERAMALADVVFISKDWAHSRGLWDMRTAATHTSQHCKPGSVVVCAWGEKGAAAHYHNSVVMATATAPRNVVDTLGAGDTFIAGFLYARSHDDSVEQALNFACRLAALKCTVEGYEGLQALLDKWS